MFKLKIGNNEYELNTSAYVLVLYKKTYGVDITKDLKKLGEISQEGETDFDLLCRIILNGIKTTKLAQGQKDWNELDYLLVWEPSDLTNENTVKDIINYTQKLLGVENKGDGAPNPKK